jgi:hypothetical protein
MKVKVTLPTYSEYEQNVIQNVSLFVEDAPAGLVKLTVGSTTVCVHADSLVKAIGISKY